jgi:hypothetical protein
LDYADHRYYSSSLGRFLTADPTQDSVDLTNPQSLNAFAYVLGDPVNVNDPSGLDPVNLPPLRSVNQPQCVTALNSWTENNFGESYNSYLNSAVGILGITSFFEDEGSFAPNSSAEQTKQLVWTAIDWTFLDRYNLTDDQKMAFYGRNNVPADFIQTITGSTGSQDWSNGQLKDGFLKQLTNILAASPTSNDCYAFAISLDTAVGVVGADIGKPLIPGTSTYSNPFPGALQFASGGVVPGHSRLITEHALGTVDGFVFYVPVPTAAVRRPPPHGHGR